jgi:signal transduction histidine kinase
MDGGAFRGAISSFSNDKLSTGEMAEKFDENSELVRLLKTRKKILIKEELAEIIENDEIDVLAEELKPFNGKIVAPFFIEDRLNFILILGEKLSGDIYSDEDINLLSTISSQAAVSLKNAMLYGELEQRVEDRTAALSMTNEQLKNEIAERKRFERELKRFAYKLEQSNKELEDFTRIVSHDLQEPLWKVKMFGDRLKAGYAEVLGEKGKNYMESMYGAVTRMQLLINDLMTLSRVTIGAQPNISVDLNMVIRDVLLDLEVRIEEVKGRIETDSLPVIEADPSQMRQLFQNLIGNALKFHCEGSPPVIRISGRIADADPGDLSIKLCTIEVEDNGIGFDVNYLDYIFGVFQRLHGRDEYKGTGVGLSICRKIVERHGGNITAKSREGQGSTFIVTLPVSQSSLETAEEISNIYN